MKKISKALSWLLIVILFAAYLPTGILANASEMTGERAAEYEAEYAEEYPEEYAAEHDNQVRVIVKNDTYSTKEGAAWSGTLIDTWVDLQSDSNGMTVLADAISESGYTQTGAEISYITEVNGLSAYDAGSSSGWMVNLNDWFTTSTMSDYKVSDHTLSAGDQISCEYSSEDWGADIGSDWMGTDTSLKSLIFSDGELDTEFYPATMNYTLTVDANIDSLKITPTALNRNYQVRVYLDEYTPESDSLEIKRNDSVSVSNGTKIYIGVGNTNWPSMNSGQSETVYTLTINKKSATDQNPTDDPDKGQEKPDTNPEKPDAIPDKDPEKEPNTEQDAILSQVTTNIKNNVLPVLLENANYLSGEWTVIGLASSGNMDKKDAEQYYKNIATYLNKIGSEKLSGTKSTDNARVVLALSALGYDPTDIEGFNLLEPLTDYHYVTKQGINGAVWSLIALDSANYQLPALADGKNQTIREDLVAYITDRQIADGGFSLDGINSDSDMTAMVIQALRPYTTNESVKNVVDRAVDYLIGVQNEDGSFGMNGIGNCESTAQAVIALTAMGIDPKTDSRFIKNGISVIDALNHYYLNQGQFSHLLNTTANQMATEQAYLALVSYHRFTNKEATLYDYSNVVAKEHPNMNAETVDQNATVESETEQKNETDKVNGQMNGKKAPETLDGSRIWLYLMLTVCSIAAFTIVLPKKKIEK